MSLTSFDIVVGMDCLAANHAKIFCSKRIIKVPTTSAGTITIYGEKGRKTTTIISFLKAHKCLTKGCPSYITYVIDTKLEKK